MYGMDGALEQIIRTQNEYVNYVIECADLVGIKITEKTSLDFKLIAEIMRRMRGKNERH